MMYNFDKEPSMDGQYDRKQLVDIINNAVISLLGEISGLSTSIGATKLTLSPSMIDGYAVLMGLIEDYTGNFILNLSADVSRQITAIMNQVGEDSLSEGQESAELLEASIGEIANMIVGRAVTDFGQLGIRCDITTPTIFSGQNLKLVPRGQIVYESSITVGDKLVNVLTTLRKN